jgi:non-canonical purine NTP pyrophosphatase (RdgB/HAM1 family)
MRNIIFISENVNKFKELEHYLLISEFNNFIKIQMIKPDNDLLEIQSMNRHEIIKHKLEDAFTCNKLFINSQHFSEMENNIETWIMVEDTSFEIEFMGGFPGPFVKYYLQSIPLIKISNSNLGSNAHSYVNLAIGRLTQYNEIVSVCFEGSIEGNISEPKGNNGFGFDPIFRPKGTNFTNAEMSMEQKEKYNPRTIAFKQVLEFLSK